VEQRAGRPGEPVQPGQGPCPVEVVEHATGFIIESLQHDRPAGVESELDRARVSPEPGQTGMEVGPHDADRAAVSTACGGAHAGEQRLCCRVGQQRLVEAREGGAHPLLAAELEPELGPVAGAGVSPSRRVAEQPH